MPWFRSLILEQQGSEFWTNLCPSQMFLARTSSQPQSSRLLTWKGLGQMALWVLLHPSLTSTTIVAAFLWLPESFFSGHVLLRDSQTAAGDSKRGSSGSSHVLAWDVTRFSQSSANNLRRLEAVGGDSVICVDAQLHSRRHLLAHTRFTHPTITVGKVNVMGGREWPLLGPTLLSGLSWLPNYPAGPWHSGAHRILSL